MKKITILILLFTLSLCFINPIAANETDDIVVVRDTDAYFDWEIISNNGAYLLQSNRILNTSTFVDLTIYTMRDFAYDGNPDEQEVFVFDLNSESSRLTTYQSASSVSALHNYDIDYPDAFYKDLMFLNYDNLSNYGAELGDVYFDITLVLSDTLTSDERDFVLAVANNDTIELTRIINENNLNISINDLDFTFLDIEFTQVSNEVDPNDLSQLPDTEGSIYDDTNKMGDVEILNIDNYTVDFRITYDLQPYDISYTFSENTDMSIFNSQYEMFYYTDDDQHFIVFNLGDTSMFYSTNDSVETFIPYTTWNLDTNELASIERFNVYMYMKKTSGEHLTGYFYVDEFVIDNLLSVNAEFKYRFEPTIGKAGDWNYYQTVLEDGEFSESNVSWKLKGAVYSSAAVAIGSMIPQLQAPAMIIGTPLSLYFQYKSYQELLDGNNLWVADTEEIQKLDASETLQDEINAAYLDAYAEFEGLNLDTYSLWQLDFGTFEKPFNEVKVDEDSVNIISFTYMTNGLVYTIDEENIDLKVTIDDGLVPGEDDTLGFDAWDWIVDQVKSLYENNPGIVLIVLGIVFMIVVGSVASVLKALKKPFKAFLTPLGLIVAITLLIGLLLLLGG